MSNNFYLGLQLDLDYLYRMKLIPDDHYFIPASSSSLLRYPVEALNVGLGINALYDSRDNIINPRTGTYIEFSNHFYSSIFGSEYNFSSFILDTRQYINPFENHTLAMRAFTNLRFSEEPIPLRGLSRVGGYRFIRGYYKGTYQDKHMITFEVEYRWPFWKGDVDAPIWKLWKRLGIVGFISGAQVMHDMDDFSPHRFNMAAGAGIRILFNKDSKLNIRIDYGIGLNKDSNGPGKRQSGLYFFLAEAF